jgi:inosine-uridine nucleoside N-ribohydrolase
MSRVEQNIVVTDHALGDDHGAVAYVVGEASLQKEGVLFVAGYGNRSSSISYDNLKDAVPALMNELETPLSPLPKIVYGVDKPTGRYKKYAPADGGIEYVIHGDLGHDSQKKSYVHNRKRSVHAYHELASKDVSINVLSLAATSELPLLLDRLHTQINELIVMGGVLSIQGNTGPHLEANFTHDPASTHKTLVLSQEYNVPFVLVPLDTTEQEHALFTEDRIKYLLSEITSACGKHVVESVVGLGSAYGDFYRSRFHHNHEPPYGLVQYAGVPVHDLVAAIVQTDRRDKEGIFEYSEVPIMPNSLGQIGVAREYMQPNFPVTVAGKILDDDKFWGLVVERLNAFR